jgi:hypothetical protein
MRITQAYVPSPLHASGFHKKFGLSEYKSLTDPVCFFGAHLSVLPIIKKHKGHVTLIWIGMDAYNLSIGKHDVPFIRGCRNIATSKSIQKVLNDNQVPNEYHPISCFDFKDVKPEPLGDKIYFYYGKPSLYNLDMMKEIEKRIDYKVIYVKGWTKYTREETFDLYRQCFAGVRLREIDGLSNTGIELGLMGRMVIHNGDAPNNECYEDISDIIDTIPLLFDMDPVTVSNKVREFIDIGDDWLNYGI